MGMDGGHSINLAQDAGQWRAFIDTVMSLGIQKGKKYSVIKKSLCI
jgi:Fe2+ transport system protein FeoA